MTTKNIDLQQLCENARNAGNDSLYKVANTAWDMLEEVDHYCEWSEQTVEDVLGYLWDIDSELAAEFESELGRAA